MSNLQGMDKETLDRHNRCHIYNDSQQIEKKKKKLIFGMKKLWTHHRSTNEDDQSNLRL